MLCRLLHGLAATPAAAWAAAGQGGTVYALSVLLPTAPPLEASRVRDWCSHEWQAPSPSRPCSTEVSSCSFTKSASLCTLSARLLKQGVPFCTGDTADAAGSDGIAAGPLCSAAAARPAGDAAAQQAAATRLGRRCPRWSRCAVVIASAVDPSTPPGGRQPACWLEVATASQAGLFLRNPVWCPAHPQMLSS